MSPTFAYLDNKDDVSFGPGFHAGDLTGFSMDELALHHRQLIHDNA